MENNREYASPWHSPRPTGATVDCIVIHDTASDNVESPLSWTTIESHQARVSYHYLIAKDGRVFQTVDEDRKAWHAGTSTLWGRKNVNDYSIGIAFVDLDRPGVPLDAYPAEQLVAGAQLSAGIMRRHPGIWLNRIVGHEHIAPGRKLDPGSDFPWGRFLHEVALRFALDGNPLGSRHGDAGMSW